MNICHVITRLIIGGAQENTLLTCRGLIERGHRVTLVAGVETGPEGSLWEQARQTGCELVELNSMVRAVRPRLDRRARRELTRVLQQLRPDVVHTHSSKAGIVGRLAAARAGVPLIVHTIHGMSFNRTQAWATQRLYRFLERRAARVTTAFVSVADAMTEQAVAAGLADRERFATVYSGMETERFGPRPELRERNRRQWGIGPDEVVAGTIARLFSHKGYEEIIAAMPRAVAAEPRLRFVWIGGGPHQERYRKRLEAMGLSDRVQMVGLIPPEEVPSHLNGLDMLVHASQWEGLPRTVVQALLTEIPALSFANDGAPEVVVPGETGLLVPLGDTDGLARAMVTLAGDPDLRRRLGSAGRRRCLAMFDWRTMVEKIEAIYRGLQPLPAERRGDGAP